MVKLSIVTVVFNEDEKLKMEIKKRLQREFFSRFYYDKGGERKFIYVAGSGRSGTTWLADNICQMYDFRLIFEPFWHLHLTVDGIEDFFHHRFIEFDNSSYDDQIQYVLSGNYRNFRTNRNYHFGPYQGRVIKDICANLFLKRIRVLYPELPILFMIRNPFAVINSRLMKKKWAKPWGQHAHLFNEQRLLRYKCNFENKITPDNELEDHTITYCYENYLPLKWYLEDKSIFKLVVYERVLQNPIENLKEIDSYINSCQKFKKTKSLEKISENYKMSSKESQETIRSDKKAQLSKWEKNLSEKQVKTIKRILKEFQFDDLFKRLGLDSYLTA